MTSFVEVAQIVEKARAAVHSKAVADRARRRTEEMRPLAHQALQRLQREVERLAKQDGKLPDADTIAQIAFIGAMRDPWSLALKYNIVDAQAGKYTISSAGNDLMYDTADDPRIECEIGKP
jgi:hypothetical protein